MSALLPRVHVVVPFVADISRSQAFWCDVLGLPMAHEDAVDLRNPKVVAKRGGARFQRTSWVEAVDAVADVLCQRGVTFVRSPAGRPWRLRCPCVMAPDGHVLAFAQDIANRA